MLSWSLESALALLAVLGTIDRIDAGYQAARVQVVAELFTSEGCSSCPPADDLLRRLIDEQPIDGVEVIGLSEHVDYWDHQGWKDPFSSPKFTIRQAEYGRVFGADRIYTPQLVVDGQVEINGSDAAKVKQALSDAARRPRATLAVTAVLAAPRSMSLRIDVAAVPESDAAKNDLDVVVAIVENGLVNEVKRGENAQRTLHHSAVARRMDVVGSLPRGARGGTFSRTLPVGSKWTAPNLRVVVFLQHRGSRRICGSVAASIQQP